MVFNCDDYCRDVNRLAYRMRTGRLGVHTCSRVILCAHNLPCETLLQAKKSALLLDQAK